MKKSALLLLLLFLQFQSFSQSLLKDITTSNASSQPRNMLNANGTLYFQTEDVRYGKGGGTISTQLWKTDGTTSGTIQLVNPTYPSTGPYMYGPVATIGTSYLFEAYQNTYGTELYSCDGSTTTLLSDIYVGSGSSYPNNFVSFGNKVIFQANDGIHGSELWITDGTSANTVLLKDITPGSGGSSSYNFIVNGGKIYFISNDGTSGSELWVSDGTTAGTYLLADIYPGSSSSYPSNFIPAGSNLFFTATSPAYGTELWVTDGSTAHLVSDIYSGSSSSSISGIVALNNKVIFQAYNGTDYEPWISDGTAANTSILKDINPTGYSYSQDFTLVGTTVFFDATDGVNGTELWKTDGTAAGTVIVKDINATSIVNSNLTFSSNGWQRKFINMNGTLYFLANSGAEGFELWKSDGTSAGTTLVKDFVTGGASASYGLFSVMGSNLYFSANDDSGGTYFWKTDGTTANTIKVNDLTPSLNVENIYPLLVVSNKMYFAAYNATTGYELYSTDGSTVTFIKDMDTNPHGDGYDFTFKTGIGQTTLFGYNDNKRGYELWKTDGSTTQTQSLMDFKAYPNTSSNDYWSNSTVFYDMIAYNGYTYIIVSGNGIWRTDGTTTSLWRNDYGVTNFAIMNGLLYWTTYSNIYSSDGSTVSTVASIASNYSISNLKAANGLLYFTAGDNTTGNELWKSDGLVGGTTTIVKDITPGSGSTSFYYPNDFTAVGNKLFFTVYDSNGRELWVSDGTNAGTFMVKDIYGGSNGSYPGYLTSYNNLLIFSANDGVHGNELWKSDGTTAGTTMLADINSGSGSSYPENDQLIFTGNSNYSNWITGSSLCLMNNKIYFYAQNSQSSTTGLYVTDGTTTSLVKGNMQAFNLTAANNSLYFEALDYSNGIGYELFKSDGTAAGTGLVKDINIGGGSSYPTNFFYNNNLLYFMAYDNAHGFEPYVMKICSDNQTITTALNGSNVYQVNQWIKGNTQNQLSNTSRSTYNAGNYVLLESGFSTNTGAVFLAKIQGCVYDPTNPPVAGSSRLSAVNSGGLDTQTIAYLKDEQNKPSFQEFVDYSGDAQLRDLYNRYQTELAILKTQDMESNRSVASLTQIAKENLGNQPINQSFKEQVLAIQEKGQDVTLKLAQYSWHVETVKNPKGVVSAYDLIIQMGTKQYKNRMNLRIDN